MSKINVKQKWEKWSVKMSKLDDHPTEKAENLTRRFQIEFLISWAGQKGQNDQQKVGKTKKTQKTNPKQIIKNP